MLEFRARNRVSEEYIATQMAGKLLTDKERVITLNAAGGPVRLLQPNGQPLCVYLPGAVKPEMDATYSTLQRIRGTTDNRGLASGSKRVDRNSNTGKRSRSKLVMSNILGAFDAVGGSQYCRLTSYNAHHLDEFEQLLPLFQAMDHHLAAHVPERYMVQNNYARHTPQDWVIPGTVFTTITVNSTYPTGVHTDKGDLDEGFSCLAVGRRGDWEGGILTFPAYGVGVDMQDGDLVLMDAHQWHGNTPLACSHCGEGLDKPGHVCDGMPGERNEAGPPVSPERISVVAYYRTGMRECGTMADEDAKRAAINDRKTEQALA